MQTEEIGKVVHKKTQIEYDVGINKNYETKAKDACNLLEDVSCAGRWNCILIVHFKLIV